MRPEQTCLGPQAFPGSCPRWEGALWVLRPVRAPSWSGPFPDTKNGTFRVLLERTQGSLVRLAVGRCSFPVPSETPCVPSRPRLLELRAPWLPWSFYFLDELSSLLLWGISPGYSLSLVSLAPRTSHGLFFSFFRFHFKITL